MKHFSCRFLGSLIPQKYARLGVFDQNRVIEFGVIVIPHNIFQCVVTAAFYNFGIVIGVDYIDIHLITVCRDKASGGEQRTILRYFKRQIGGDLVIVRGIKLDVYRISR